LEIGGFLIPDKVPFGIHHNANSLLNNDFDVTNLVNCDVDVDVDEESLNSLYNKYENYPKERMLLEGVGRVTILERGEHHLVAWKPPAVVCHHSGYVGSRSRLRRGEEPEIPMLQRVRDATGENRRVNLVHRLDRGASGALLLAFADEENSNDKGNPILDLKHDDSDNFIDDESNSNSNANKTKIKGATASLISSMASDNAQKTYLALVRGEGILKGEDLKQKGWFEVERPIKDEKGVLKNATTEFLFVSGQANATTNKTESVIDTPRLSLVLARPKTGRWHQIRRHLNGISHPILGDSTHGNSKINREWKEKRNMPGARTCLHLAKLDLPPTQYTPNGIKVSCPIPRDMLQMMTVHAPKVLSDAIPILQREGIQLFPTLQDNYYVRNYPIPPEFLNMMNNTKTKHNKLDENNAKDNIQKHNTYQSVKILSKGINHVAVYKPPGVVCHHSAWTGKVTQVVKRNREPTPMLQRVRDITGRKVNPLHRLDRGASGCLIFSFADDNNIIDEKDNKGIGKGVKKKSTTMTNALITAMQSEEATKTYVALCHGDGTWKGEDLLSRGWFTVDAPIKDEHGKLMTGAKTQFRFIAGSIIMPQDDDKKSESRSESSDTAMDKIAKQHTSEGNRIAVVLARPSTGKWHQIRQHLSSKYVGHAILGDSVHGYSRTNRIWKEERGMMTGRTYLHLARVQIPETPYTQGKLDISCPIPEDMANLLYCNVPNLWNSTIKKSFEENEIKIT